MLIAAPLQTCLPMTVTGRCVGQCHLDAGSTMTTLITVTTRLVRPVVPV